MAKKVYAVKVEISVLVPVYAEGTEEAYELAEKHLMEEIDNGGFKFETSRAYEPGDPGINWRGLRNSVPWGERDYRTIDEILATEGRHIP